MLGIVFDTRECLGNIAVVCQVSFSIPVVTWEYSCSPNLCCSPILLGIVFDTREECAVHTPMMLGIIFDTQVGVVLSVVGMLHFLIMLGIVFDTRECLGNIAVVCQVSFSIPVVVS